MTESVTFEVGGKPFVIETGELAKQANGAVLVKNGDNCVLTTACVSGDAKFDIDFFPLTVEYREKFYAAGRFPGGFFKREGRVGSKETLISRLIDRSIRPLFPDGFRNEVQILATVFSHDGENPTDISAMIGASAALAISEIPFDGPIGAVRVGILGDDLVINPTFEDIPKLSMDITVAGTKKAICMVEGELKCIPEAKVVEALEKAHSEIAMIVTKIEEFAARVGKQKKQFELFAIDEQLKKDIYADALEKMRAASGNSDKLARLEEIAALKTEVKEKFLDPEGTNALAIKIVLHDMESEIVRNNVLEHQKREDGRGVNDIRDIEIKTGYLPRTHGSSVFTRGQTQSLGVLTLGPATDMQMIDEVEGVSYKRFMLHYNFPSYSVGEARRLGPVSRREIGHGMLAERALTYVLPDDTVFPYTIRIVSEILESNGSSSMASICSGSMALMDGGVPIKEHVAGIAMGLVIDEEKGNFVVLTDIQGLEDHCGDMDFKVAGTREGITAIQMDIKVKGIRFDVVKEALERARDARLFILDKMNAVLDKPRSELSPYAPIMRSIHIDPEKIREVIGAGGKTIRSIVQATGAAIDIKDTGEVIISSSGGEKVFNKAKDMIEDIVADVEIGKIYSGVVSRIEHYGCFVNFANDKQGLIHISQLAEGKKTEKVSDVVNLNDTIKFKVTEVDKQGRIGCSLRGVTQD